MEKQSIYKIGKIISISAITIGINHLLLQIAKKIINSNQHSNKKKKAQQFKDCDEYIKWGKKELVEEYNQAWGSFKMVDSEYCKDGLLKELKMMTQVIHEVERINNIIVDLQMTNVIAYSSPIIAHKVKIKKDDPYLNLSAVIKPGQFIIQNCVFRAGQSIECEKKFMVAGPRSTQFFDPYGVRADIVCLGSISPGVNTVIRELVIVLKEVYKVPIVKGIKYSFKGYYENKNIQLNPQMIKTIHHTGGCYLGVCKTEFNVGKIVDNLIKRKVNQVYFIGGKNTLKSANEIYQQIKRRKEVIAICVLLKAINKQIKMFDTIFGFQSAVEETQKIIEAGYVSSRSNSNGIALIKVPGKMSGFLALDACRAARNVNICLVPQFKFDLYGQKGLLNYLSERIRHKGNCMIVYSEGALKSARDLNIPEKKYEKDEKLQSLILDMHFKELIEKSMFEKKLLPCNVLILDGCNQVRSVPANSFDTKLCCQIAHSSIHCLMCGYTNFVSGHLTNRTAMIPVRQLICEGFQYYIRPYDENWQRLLASTGQPSFINSQNQVLL